MDFKQMLHKYTQKVKNAWNEGKIQRSSRITYDVFWNVILFFLVVGVIGAFFVGGLGAGYFASLVKDEPVRSYASMKQDIYNYEQTSKLYFAGGNYFGNVRSDIHREEVTLDEVSDKLIHAVIATEDSNYRMHEGIVPKAIVRAMVQQVTNAPMQSGGSTLTQQLVKNQILTNEVSFERKAKEILIAMRVERFFDKDEILEAYLNIIPYGRNASGQNIAGIQTAAQGIFGVDASELNLPQAAFLAGLPQSPSYYTPFKNSGGLKNKEGLQPGLNRMSFVLERMHEAGYITKKQYEKALNYNIVDDFSKESKSPIEKYPYLTFEAQERAKQIIIEHLAKQDGYSMKELKENDDLMGEYTALADRAMRQNGYKIHTTINKKIHDKFKQIVKNYDYYGEPWTGEVVVNYETGKTKTITQKIQTGGILIENSTGKIISFIGGRDYNQNNQLNYTTRPRPNGSTMKPILDYAPAMELGKVQPGTPIADVSTTFQIPGSDNWSPSNYIQGSYHGIVSARKALADSYNIPAAKVYSRIINQNPAKNFLIEGMGITTLTKGDQHHMSLSLGQPTKGISVEENTNAFSTFGNRGKFNDAYLIQKITTADGKVIYKHKKNPEEVFSRQTNYLTIDMMRDVIDSGTASYLNSQLKYDYVDWAGKTGTSNNWEDTWFVGVNPKVTFGTWMGYKTPQSIKCSSCSLGYSNRNIKLWAELINAASDIRPDLVAPQKNFDRPGGIVSRSYCAISGKLPSDLCKQAGLVMTDLFNAKYAPTETGNSLIEGSYVMVNGQAVVAGPNTPAEFTKGDGLAFNPAFLERKGWDRLGNLSKLFPRTNRDKWSKIGLPPSDASSNAIEDDGKAPKAPSGVSISGGKLTWNESGSDDVVGYRIYKASSSNGSYSKVGSTTGTSTSISGSGAYIVRAVDYFGLESSASKPATSGQPDKPEKDGKNKPDKPDEPENPGDTGNNENNDSNNGNNGGTDNGNGNTGDEGSNGDGADSGDSGGDGSSGNGESSNGGPNNSDIDNTDNRETNGNNGE
ncbi:transglycosylase domain-containing protein [Virgibacillus ihumii]|uniref:transglycosylase domain-containing protein n=1 Tax=Virgibacillus ihumii TaxID=2686091 RepID=UPI00157CD835|nr:transglycosylase domain-containing protein [Virgibacillus ihumii]